MYLSNTAIQLYYPLTLQLNHDTTLKATGTIDLTAIVNSSLSSVNLSSLGPIEKSTNPHTPLFETRLEFIDLTKFYGSTYFFNAIGYHLDTNTKRLLGDDYYNDPQVSIYIRNFIIRGKILLRLLLTLLNHLNLHLCLIKACSTMLLE